MNYKAIYKSVLALSVFAACVLGVFMAVSLADCSGDSGLDIYNSKSVEYFGLVSYSFAAFCVLFFAASTTLGRRVSKKLSFDGLLSQGAYIGMGVFLTGVFAFYLFREVWQNISGIVYDAYVISAPNTDPNSLSQTEISWLFLAFMVLLAASAAFFFFAAFNSKKHEEPFALASMIPSAAIVIKIIYDFLLQSNHGYGSLYNFHLLGLCFVLLFSVNESRFYFKRGIPFLYIFFGITGATASVIFSISTFTLLALGRAGSNWHPAFCVADIAIAVYIYIRLFTLNVREFAKHDNDSEVKVFDNATSADANADAEG